MTKEHLLVLLICAGGTILTRFLPYLLFPQGKETPEYIRYLGNVLAPAVFAILVVYCLRNVTFFSGNFGIPELLGCAMTAILFVWKRQMILSMAGGTLLYMILVQTVFVG